MMDEKENNQTSEPEQIEPSTSWADNSVLRIGVNLAAIALVLFLVFLIWQRFSPKPADTVSLAAAPTDESVNKPSRSLASVDLVPLATPATSLGDGIPRWISLNTIIPTRPRSNVITYTVHTGDNLFGIADTYGLKPETLLWGNYDTLKDNPHLLSPGQVLNILPVDGAYYQWKEGDNINSVADYYNVDPEEIISYPGNDFDLTKAKDGNPGVEPGAWLIIPGGTRPIKDWGPPAISRSNPAVAKYYGPGSCGAVYEGAYGTGTFIWPTTEHFISGYHYSAIHRAIDIGGVLGNPVVASDSGVVVYAGWSNYGYGNLIVIDHGGGWQTAYAHLNSIAVRCGQSVYQGGYIGALGTTGNSSGPHLHFEIVYQGTKPNPLDYLP
jgi:murein DD-endopeptidase MepM/ murein hydrolase activator NlpD